MLFRILLFLSIPVISFGQMCGTDRMIRHLHEHPASAAKETIASAWPGSCPAEALYDPNHIQVDTTEHFRIYWTLSGPHAVMGGDPDSAAAFIALLRKKLEEAWSLHTQTLSMLAPLGSQESWQFQRTDFPAKYPVEVVDISLLKDSYELFGGPCGACYGVTLPGGSIGSGRSSLVVENDFLYWNSGDPMATDTQQSCDYVLSGEPVTSWILGESRNQHKLWRQALAVTVFHELYHACQLRYQDYREHYHAWYEASAVGVESVGEPGNDDYLQYISPLFERTWISVAATSPAQRMYGQGIFWQFLHHELGNGFDAHIWKSLETQPDSSLPRHITTSIETNYGLSFDTLFHHYALSTYFTGNRAGTGPVPEWNDQMSEWPLVKVNDFATEADSISLPALSFRWYRLPDSWVQASAGSTGGEQFSLLRVSGDSITWTQLGNNPGLLSPSGTDTVLLLASAAGLSGGITVQGDSSSTSNFLGPVPWRPPTPLCLGSAGKPFPGADLYGPGGMRIWRAAPLKEAGRRCLEANGLSAGVYRVHFLDERRMRPVPLLK